jgi:transcriptional regulator with XRE-family HTH domain
MRRRQLGMELRRLREDADKTIEEVARHIGRASSTVSRIETGSSAARPAHVRALLDLYGVPSGPERDALLALAKDGQRKGWWSEFDDVLSVDFERYLGYEGGAASLRVYENRLIHGLLQTADYARASFRAVRIYEDPADIQRRVDLRLRRQELLHQPTPLTLRAILDESALRRIIGGPQTMRAQLRHLLAVGEQPNVTIQILPFLAGPHAGLDGPFTLIEFPGHDPEVVYVEGPAGNIYLEKPRDLRRTNSIFDHLQSEALDPDESRAFIHATAEEIR